MDELKHYVQIIKQNLETLSAPDYEGKDEELLRQQEELEKVERHFLLEINSSENFDQIVNAAVKCASNEISLDELEDEYNLLTK
ncbi:YnfE family protein [Metabacillus sp. B2-18]|uniref:YnfE family protein n=1 Tax=Metabacillus sp. B2-18 TaxID=2897333 RepID=UPI001E3662FD|nr:YnfE family protein [Metabacillus sp. B2-18]UGB32908.1 YnfE family protein [Metabacillus sp. B2-18]